MTLKCIRQNLLADLEKLGIDVDSVDFVLKPYSKTMYGNFKPAKNRITVYCYTSPERDELYDYELLLKTSIHEFVHSIQHKSEGFKRVKGVMHNSEFYRMLDKYCEEAERIGLFEKQNNLC